MLAITFTVISILFLYFLWETINMHILENCNTYNKYLCEILAFSL